ncbi:MAG: VCBS repeat-containing protein [Planctomycetota bacterium]|nr:MAG: VCBS repeat-containing protein [Planctomycetota bacterium]
MNQHSFPILLLAGALSSSSLCGQTPTVMPGWPIEVFGNSVGGGALVNVDLDPELELIQICGSASSSSQVHVFNPDGTYVPGWPVTVGLGTFAPPAFGDIDGDGDGEIVLTEFYFGLSGSLWALHHDGNLVSGFPFSYGGPLKGPSLGDLDGDGDLEIVVGFNSGGIGSLFAIQGDGSVMPGWPQNFSTVLGSSASIADVDLDGVVEIFAPSYELLYGFRPDGSSLPGFPFDPGNQYFNYNTASLADLDHDGDREIVFATSDHFVDRPGKVWALHHDGSSVAGWPKSTQYSVFAPPSVADIDGDGNPDIAVGDQLLSPTPVNSIYAWDAGGSPLPGFPVTPVDALLSQIIIADVNGDQQLELLYESNVNGDDYHAVRHDGSPVAGWPLPVDGSSFNQALSAADVDGDGFLNLAGTGDIVSTGKTKIYLWATTSPWVDTLAPVPTPMYVPTRSGQALDSNLKLSLSGGCPGPTTATISGASPFGKVHLLYSSGVGNIVIPPPFPCSGLELGLSNLGLSRAATLIADSQGSASMFGVTPSGACGNVWLQAVDEDSCTASNVVGL